MLGKILFNDDFDPKDALFMLGFIVTVISIIVISTGELLGLVGVGVGVGLIVLAFKLVKKS